MDIKQNSIRNFSMQFIYISASEMTCIVSSGALNFTHSLTYRIY